MASRCRGIGCRDRVLAYWLALWGACVWGDAPRASGVAAEDVGGAWGVLLDPVRWRDPAWLSGWTPRPEPGARAYAYRRDVRLWGGVPVEAVTGRFGVGGELESVSVLLYDAGYAYGFRPTDEGRAEARLGAEAERGTYRRALDAAGSTLRNVAGRRGDRVVLGRGEKLRFEAEIFPLREGAARLLAVRDRLVRVTVFARADDAAGLVRAGGVRGGVETSVARSADGDVKIVGIPMLHQGNRAYCAVSVLAMAGQTLGLNLETEDYAAAARFRYGNEVASRNLLDVYEETYGEAGLEVARRQQFDWGKVRASIDRGLPVLVWRRYDGGRDALHTAFAESRVRDPGARLPEATAEDRATWPGAKAPAHASLLNGYNMARGEVIFTESWGERARDRRMRVEELEGTMYLSFLPGR